MQESKEQLPVAIDLPGAKFQMAEWGETAVAFIPDLGEAQVGEQVTKGGAVRVALLARPV